MNVRPCAYSLRAFFGRQITYIYTTDVLEVLASPLFEPILASFQSLSRLDPGPGSRAGVDYGPVAERSSRAMFFWSQLVQAWTDGGAAGLWSAEASAGRRAAARRDPRKDSAKQWARHGSFSETILSLGRGIVGRRDSSLLFPSSRPGGRRPSTAHSEESAGSAEAEAGAGAGTEAEAEAEAEIGIYSDGSFSPLGAHGAIGASPNGTRANGGGGGNQPGPPTSPTRWRLKPPPASASRP